ncbi:peptidase C26 [Sphingomonas sp. Leaf412]|uniref:gamma-glutamyl-gamma-aminobutyrate hydrolase family protein n=1 Tax=Sphingomonas sp. Leaf412 TaxID=1736370 RepID=UPI0006F68D99|nr:gamma-glutamyl-gamma-aminobutyrate hydrolase family protein [Sphingomonas sp. Leaf412]KQT34625.1 peptidase C26 [Sphingomonas sp. Leaf412]
MPAPDRRPVVGVLCCNEVAARPVQVVASRFVAPLSTYVDATVVLVPAVAGVDDVAGLSALLDGLLLTGSRSHVGPGRYGGAATLDDGCVDDARDEVALRLSAAMIEAGRPVFGICRGFQELNVLFGGTLSADICGGRHHRGVHTPFDDQFAHRHAIDLTRDGGLGTATGMRRATVNSVHEQGIDRLGTGLAVEAVASDDGLIEAISARPCGGDVLAVQWHPEWDVAGCAPSRAFFDLFHRALRP